MIPLNIILVGCGDEALARIRCELLNHEWNIEAELPNAEKVLERTASLRDRTRLFIVLTPTKDDVNQVKLLSNRFAGFPILAVADNLDQQFLLALMRAGATQIVAHPLQADDFQVALTQVSVQFARPSTASQVVAVAGVHGGCGATTIAANLGYEVAFLNKLHCILVDLSLHLGQAAVCLNVPPRFSLGDAISSGQTIDSHLVQQILYEMTDHFSLISGPCNGIERADVVATDALHVVDICRSLADVVVLDVPCTYDKFYFEALATADRVVLVGEQTVSSLRAMAMVTDQLKKERAPDSLFILFNRFIPQKSGFTDDKLANLLNVSRVFTISADLKMQNAMDSGGPIRLRIPTSPILGDLARLAAGVMGIADSKPEARRSITGILKRLKIR